MMLERDLVSNLADILKFKLFVALYKTDLTRNEYYVNLVATSCSLKPDKPHHKQWRLLQLHIEDKELKLRFFTRFVCLYILLFILGFPYRIA